MVNAYSKKQWVFQIFVWETLVFAGIQFYWLQYIDVSAIDVLSIVTNLGLVRIFIVLAGKHSEDNEDVNLQSDGNTQNTPAPYDLKRLTTQAICNIEAKIIS